MKCSVVSFTFHPEKESDPCTVELLTTGTVTEHIRMVGETFKVTKVEPRYSGGAKRVTAVCDEFPQEKVDAFSGLETEYELIEATNE